MQNEAYSRAVIDQHLKDIGWDILDTNQVVFEDHGAAGRADYVLKDKQGKPIALIEAKADLNLVDKVSIGGTCLVFFLVFLSCLLPDQKTISRRFCTRLQGVF